MSWEATVNGGKTIGADVWLKRVQRLGASLELHPDFSLETDSGVQSACVKVTRETMFGDARRFVVVGPLCASLELEIEQFGPYQGARDGDAILAAFDARLRRLGELGAPALILDHERERRASFARAVAGTPDEQRVYFCRHEESSEPDVLAFALGLAGYALASGGALYDQARGTTSTGDAILGWLAEQIHEFVTEREVPDLGKAFAGW